MELTGSLVVEEIYKSEKLEYHICEAVQSENFPCSDCCLKPVCSSLHLSCHSFSVYADLTRSSPSGAKQREWSLYPRLPNRAEYLRAFPKDGVRECLNCGKPLEVGVEEYRFKHCSEACRRAFHKVSKK